MAGPHDDWMGAMDGEVAPSLGVDTGGHGDWFNAMDQDATFGDVPPAAMTNVAKPTDYQNPTMDPDRWNIITSLAHGGSLGLADPLIVEALAKQEADSMRAAGADDATIAYMMPQWRAMAKEGIAHAQAEYHKIAPGLDLAAETLGAAATTAPAAGLITGALAKGLSAAGLGGAARFISGTAGRSGGPAAAVVRPASMATRGAAQGAETGVLQSQLNPTKSVGEQAKEGAALGAVMEAAGPLFRGVGREIGAMDQAGAQASRRELSAQLDGIASRAGVHSLTRDPRTGQTSWLLLDAALHGVPGEGAFRRELADVLERERGLMGVEQRLAAGAPRRSGMFNRLGHVGVGVGVGAGLTDSLIEILKNPSSWPYILAGVGGSTAAVMGRNALVQNPKYRNLLLRAQASGLTPAEYLGIGNPATAVGNRLMEYYTPKMEEAAQ